MATRLRLRPNTDCGLPLESRPREDAETFPFAFRGKRRMAVFAVRGGLSSPGSIVGMG
jgi:hypothetical protein